MTSLVLILLVTIAGLLFWKKDPSGDKIAACRSNVTADCLFYNGVFVMLQERSQRRGNRAVTQLSSLGRFDDAQAIFLQQVLDLGKSKEDASVSALKAVATNQFLTALNSGHDLDEALVTVPSVDASNLWLAGLELLGQDPYGVRPFHSGEPTATRSSAHVAAMASRIVLWFKAGSPKSLAWQLKDAAELRARLEDRQGVLEVLRLMASNAQSATFSEQVFKVAGVDAVLAEVQQSEGSYPHLLLAAAGAASGRERAEDLLSEAFDILARRKIWPEFGSMARVVRRSADLGYLTKARSLADRMAELADTTEYPFKVFGHIHTANALYFAGADHTVVAARLDVAESLFPADPSKVVAVGLIGGLMQWKKSGLAQEARWGIASVAAYIGDIDRAKRMFDGLDDPVTAWLGFVEENIPVSSLSQLMVFAEETLPPHDYAYVAGQFARFSAASERSAQHHDWALELVRDLAATGQTRGDRSAQIFSALARVSFGAGEVALGRRILASMADEALERRDGAALVNVGFLYEIYGFEKTFQ